MTRADAGRHPDLTGKRLVAAIRRTVSARAENIVLGNGSENILELLCQAVLDCGDLVVTQAPGFSLHEIFPRMMGARVAKVPVTGAELEHVIAATPESALLVLDEAEERSLFAPCGRLVESTSGNTGVGLALIAAERGYGILVGGSAGGVIFKALERARTVWP